MPTIDPELLAPLSKISDMLLKRPGKVSLEAIKRLSNIYGFETFTDTLSVSGEQDGGKQQSLVLSIGSHAGTQMSSNLAQVVDRLSLSGKILLIDIDFIEGKVKNVKLSSAINLQPIDGETYDFLEGWHGFEPVETILLRNLQCAMLDPFNKNLRILSQFDRLSHSSPNDLFNFFNQLTYNLANVGKYEENQAEEKMEDETEEEICPFSKKETLHEMDCGYAGLGKLLMNQDDKIGLFLKIWEDNRFVSRLLEETKQVKTVESLNPYLIHFKITESFKSDAGDAAGMMDEEDEEDEDNDKAEDEDGDDAMGDVTNSGVGGETGTATVGGRVTGTDIKNSTGGTGGSSNTAAQGTTGETGRERRKAKRAVKVRWFDNGEWLINSNDTMLQSNLNLLVLEMCPSLWIPRDLLVELGIQDYEVRSADNDFFNNNQQDLGDPVLDRLYARINSEGEAGLKLKNGGKKIRVAVLVGCPMVKIYKITFNRMDRLESLVTRLRNWCLVDSLLRNLALESVQVETVSSDDAAAGAAGTAGKETQEKEDTGSNGELADEDLRLDDVMNDEVAAPTTGGALETSTGNVVIETLRGNEVAIWCGNRKLRVRNGAVWSFAGKDKAQAELLTRTERLDTMDL